MPRNGDRLMRQRICLVATALPIAAAAGFLFLLVAANGFTRNFGPREKTLLAAPWPTSRVTRGVAQISLIPRSIPAMLAFFVRILQRSGFGFSVAFSDTSITLDTKPSEVVSENQVAAEKYRGA
jgi:hypothetical protein